METYRTHDSNSNLSEQKFSLIFEYSPFPICLVEMPSSIIADVNPAFLELFEFSKEDVVGKTSVELNMHQDLSVRSQIYEQFQKHGFVRNVESKVYSKSGRSIYISNNMDSIEIGGQLHVLVTLQDITERKIAEIKLQEASKTRDDFLSIASHELKTPLTTIILQTEIQKHLTKTGNIAPPLKTDINKTNENIIKGVSRLNRLVNDMLDISRIQTGKMSVNKQNRDLVAITEEVITAMDFNFNDNQVKIHFTSPASIIGPFDPLRIEQLISNLIQNSLKYGSKKDVQITLSSKDNIALLVVKDLGVGISREDHIKIFEKFVRSSSQNSTTGFGLGLYICKQIVDAHVGKIWVESEIGAGASFYVELPLT